MTLRALQAIFVALILCASSARADDHETNHIEVADYLKLEQVSDAQISPDGEEVIYARRYIDQM